MGSLLRRRRGIPSQTSRHSVARPTFAKPYTIQLVQVTCFIAGTMYVVSDRTERESKEVSKIGPCRDAV